MNLTIRKFVVFVLPAVMLFAASAIGDWDTDDPHKMHYPQMPDLTTAGMDVLAGPFSIDANLTVYYEKFLADDFLCTESGPITGIHIWCSYRGNLRYMEPPILSLVIYDNVPAGTGGIDYSRPGQALWDRYVQPTVERIYASGAVESFYDPNPDEIVGTDTEVWQYNFKFDAADAFYQYRDNIYWLGLKHTFDLNGNGMVSLTDLFLLKQWWPGSFGWKTSVVEQYEDAAVWTDVLTFNGAPHIVPMGPWLPMDYPDVHEYAGQPIDLAFVITGPEPVELDFGDAPRPYPTLQVVDGARHIIGGPYFCDSAGGDSPDPEGDGQPHLNALGDDNDGNDDEDGVQIPPLTVGVASNITLDVCGSNAGGAVVEIWIDWHSDGSWDASDMVFSGLLADGAHTVGVVPPWDAVNGPTFARCRISSTAGPGPTGQADDGEVEDHQVDIEGGLKHPVPHLKWSQPPIPMYPDDEFPTYCGWDEESYWVEHPTGSTPVYENWDANGYVYDFMPGAGLPVADDISLAGTERKLDHYNFSVISFDGTAPYNVTSELYYDDGAGLPGLAIAGTFCNHNVAVDGYVVLDCAPGSGAILPNNLWLVLTFDTDWAGWCVGEAAELGFTHYAFAHDEGTGLGWQLYWFGGIPYASFEANIWCESEHEEDLGVTVADDFRCIGPMPVDSIHWWGSYVGWNYPDELPPELPIGWRIGFWSNDASGQNCDSLYGATNVGDLYRIDPFTGVAALIGPIGFGGVTGLSFAPDGTLYGSCRDWVMGLPLLITIDTMTGAGTAVGSIDPAGMQWAVPDISFDSNGVLYGYGHNPDQLITINTATGQGTVVGATGYFGQGNGMDFAPNGTLYATPSDNQSLVIINPATGVGSDVAGTVGNVPIRVNALEFCDSTGVLYGSWNDSWFSGNWYLVTLDLNTGLPLTIVQTVIGLDAIAFNEHSRPKELLKVFEVDDSRVQIEWVGWDYYYDFYPSDTCYQYYVDLEPEEVFWQDDYLDRTEDGIFWLSITAIYPEIVPPMEPQYPWGWKTRPWSWMDDAVRFHLHEEPVPGSIVDPCDVEPIKDPRYNESFDVAFELDTDPNYIKWEQPFTSILHWPHFEDELSMGSVMSWTEYKWWQDPNPDGWDVALKDFDDNLVELADDWQCDQTGTIDDIHFWVSWEGDMVGWIPWITVRIYTDDPCDPGIPGDYSQPDELRWERTFGPGEFNMSYDGSGDQGWFEPVSWEWWLDDHAEYYIVDIDVPDNPFIQEEGNIYWLSVEANSVDGWVGWKTSIQQQIDDAVYKDPYTGEWQELEDPQTGVSLDLAFILTSKSEDLYIDRLVADDWPCEANTPITTAVWWGSYLGYGYEACQDVPSFMQLPVPPDYFLLNIWTDVPADSCDPALYSHPNEAIWKYEAYDYDEVLVGYDKHPHDGPPVVFDGGAPDLVSGNEMTNWAQAEDFTLTAATTIESVRFWTLELVGAWDGSCDYAIYTDAGGAPGALVDSGSVALGRLGTGRTALGMDEWENEFDLPAPLPLSAGTYWLVLHMSSDCITWDGVYWETGSPGSGSTGMEDQGCTGGPWSNNGYDHAFQLLSGEPGPEPVFRYSVKLPREKWFFQDEPNGVYWFSVVAVYGEHSSNYPWGWTNHKHVYNDDAVEGYLDPGAPSGWTWSELYHQGEESEDMSFILFTEPDCLNRNAAEYADWVAWGRPKCWCYPRQCRGDIDGTKTGPFHVAIPDLAIFKQCFNQFVMPPGCICADLDHIPTGPFRVGIPDLAIFKTYFNQFVVPQCDQPPVYTGPYNYWTSP